MVEGGNCLSGKERQLEYPGELYQGKGKILGVERGHSPASESTIYNPDKTGILRKLEVYKRIKTGGELNP